MKRRKKKLLKRVVILSIVALFGFLLGNKSATGSFLGKMDGVVQAYLPQYFNNLVGKDKVVKPTEATRSVHRGTQISTDERVSITSEAINKGDLVSVVNGNKADFSKEDITLNSEVNKSNRQIFLQNADNTGWNELNRSGFESDEYTWEILGQLDELNRVTQANAMLSEVITPKTDRDARLTVNPTGWKQQKVQGKTVFDRSHLIGYQFTGHNSEIRNLMTGTSELNRVGMLEYETKVRDALKRGLHVRYRVTPIFKEQQLLPIGVQMEAKSIEDNSLEFNVIVANILKGYSINYDTSKVTPIK